MSGEIIVFPIVRRHRLVRSIAEQMAARPPSQAEKHLQLQLRRQAKSLRGRFIPEDIIAEQITAFESAVRAELWRVVLTPPRPSGAV